MQKWIASGPVGSATGWRWAARPEPLSAAGWAPSRWCPALWGVLAVGGFGVLLAGLAIGYRFTVCPHCGAPLYDFPRMPSEIPAYCPSCGKKIDPPADH